MKKKTIIVFIIAVLLIAVPAAACGILGDNPPTENPPEDNSPKANPMEDNPYYMFEMGKLWAKRPIGEGDIVASYKDFTVTQEDVEWRKEYALLAGENLRNTTDREVANIFIRGWLFVEEAERQGVTYTQEEIDERIDSLRQHFADDDGSDPGLEQIYEYCAGAGITIDEYLEDLRQQLPNAILTGTLRNNFIENYYKENGIADAVKMREEYDNAMAAFYAYGDELLQAHKDEIRYYIG